MKKIIYISIVAILGFILAIETGFFNALFMFILLGMIPGTEIVVPANIMLLLISAATCGLLFYSSARSILRLILDRHVADQKNINTSRLPKQRFKKIEA